MFYACMQSVLFLSAVWSPQHTEQFLFPDFVNGASLSAPSSHFPVSVPVPSLRHLPLSSYPHFPPFIDPLSGVVFTCRLRYIGLDIGVLLFSVVSVCLFVCLSVCQRDNSRTVSVKGLNEIFRPSSYGRKGVVSSKMAMQGTWAGGDTFNVSGVLVREWSQVK